MHAVQFCDQQSKFFFDAGSRCLFCYLQTLFRWELNLMKSRVKITNCIHLWSMENILCWSKALSFKSPWKFIFQTEAPRGVGYSNYFLTECAAQGLKPIPISTQELFSLKKGVNKQFFFKIFANWNPFLRVILPESKMVDFTIFSQIMWNGTLL